MHPLCSIHIGAFTFSAALTAGGCVPGNVLSFLGIGGEPINVALIIFLLSCPAKYGDGAFPGDGSLCPDFKDRHYRTGDGVRGLCLSIAPAMAVEAIAGGFICAGLNKRFSEKAVERAFNGVQLLVLAITGYNIVRKLQW